MFGAVPGKSPFEGWLWGLIGNLASFPIVLLVIIIFDELTGSLSGAAVAADDISKGGFLPPYLIGQGSGQAITFLIGFGMLLILPDLVKSGKEMLGGKGGIFEQFANSMQDSLKKGWTGDGDLIPGALKANQIGLSGKNILSKFYRGTDASNKASEREDYGGWAGRYHRATLGRGAVGEILARYERKGKGDTQKDISTGQNFEALVPKDTTPTNPQRVGQKPTHGNPYGGEVKGI
jgi:hypothetical protein